VAPANAARFHSGRNPRTGFEVGVLNGNVRPGDVVAVVGAGPVGLAAMMTARLYGPSRVVAIDKADSRLEKALPVRRRRDRQQRRRRPGRGRDGPERGAGRRPATLHLERLWIRNVTITTGLVDTRSPPTLLRLVSEGRLDPRPFATHLFTHGQIIDAYGVFADAAKTNALKMVLTRS
jgi:alcohol dehydrogenase